jgi:hypothetical protein
VKDQQVSLCWLRLLRRDDHRGLPRHLRVDQAGGFWAAWMKYRTIHGDQLWEVVPGPFPLARHQAMANPTHQDEILSRRGIDA